MYSIIRTASEGWFREDVAYTPEQMFVKLKHWQADEEYIFIQVQKHNHVIYTWKRQKEKA